MLIGVTSICLHLWLISSISSHFLIHWQVCEPPGQLLFSFTTLRWENPWESSVCLESATGEPVCFYPSSKPQAYLLLQLPNLVFNVLLIFSCNHLSPHIVGLSGTWCMSEVSVHWCMPDMSVHFTTNTSHHHKDSGTCFTTATLTTPPQAYSGHH